MTTRKHAAHGHILNIFNSTVCILMRAAREQITDFLLSFRAQDHVRKLIKNCTLTQVDVSVNTERMRPQRDFTCWHRYTGHFPASITQFFPPFPIQVQWKLNLKLGTRRNPSRWHCISIFDT